MRGAGSGTASSAPTAATRIAVANPRQRWGAAVGFRGRDFLEFAAKYFSAGDRRELLFAGAGFDPRTPCLAEALATWASGGLDAIFIREERPAPNVSMRSLADNHAARLTAAVPSGRTE